ncbi:MAG: RcnB family protein [Desulfobulbus sp.]|nr:RcnB family protein [Desulfobulbus sp.]
MSSDSSHAIVLLFAQVLTHYRQYRFLPRQFIKKESVMYKKVLLGAIVAFMLIVSQIAVAQAAGPDYYPPDPNRPHPPAVKPPGPPPAKVYGPPPAKVYGPPPHGPSAYTRPPAPAGYNRYKFSESWRSPHGYFRPGYAMPPYYSRGYQRYIISDWPRYGLYEPPYGHQWLLVDGNFVLAAIGTGIIAQVLLAP